MQRKAHYYHLSIDLMDTREALTEFDSLFDSEELQTQLVYFINAHCFNISLKNQRYLDALQQAHFVFNDGIGIKIGARFAGIDLIENMNGTDLIPKIIQLAFEKGKNIFLLGAKEGIAIAAADNLRKRHPGIKIVGTSSGFFSDSSAVVEEIDNSGAELLIVGMGVPRQELWLADHQSGLGNVKIAVAGGAILDFLSETVKRAPLWMQNAGIEWLYRFYQEPKRLFMRYFIGNAKFLYAILKFKS